jgi:ELWxxDGT repeat protein
MPRPFAGARKPSVLVPLLVLLLSAAARAQTPYLVADARPGEQGGELVPLFLTRAGNLVFFWGESPAEGREVWRSDGTPGGTFLLRDVLPGPETSDSNGSDDNEMAALGDLLFFVARNGSDLGSGELWRSDGTPEGTFQVSDIIPGPDGPEPVELTPLRGLLFFAIQGGPGLWRSDGTVEGTFEIDLGVDVAVGGLSDLGGTLLFFAGDALGRLSLWRTDGTAAGTVQIVEGPESWQFLGRRAVAGGLLFFAVSTPTGQELWKSDGTAAGTVQVAAFAPDAGHPEALTAAGGRLFFRLDDPAAGAELWVSDGTAAGTARVKDIQPGPASSFPNRMAALGSLLYFSADDGVTGAELWRSDGTAAGTVLVADLVPGPEGSGPRGLLAAGVRLFFSAPNSSSQPGLWVSDGTAAGTFLLGEVVLDDSSTFAGVHFAAVGDVIYFSGDDGLHGRELWRSDGTRAGTWPVTDLTTGSGTHPAELTDLGGTLFYRADDRFGGACELWRSDGTAAGTAPVPDAGRGESVCPRELTVSGGTLFFRNQRDSRLWKTAGAVAVPLADGLLGVDELESDGRGGVLFRGCDAATGCELWRSDGTGAALVADLAPGIPSSSPAKLTRVGGLVFFQADDGSGLDLWRSDGIAAGTFALQNRRGSIQSPTPFGGFLFFVLPGTQGDDVWRSDGTPAGTLRVFLGYGEGRIDRLTVAGGALFYFVRRSEGVDLWRAGVDQAERLTTFTPAYTSDPEVLGAAAGRFFFSLGDAAGREPWVSDGTAAGTRRLADLYPGPGSSVPLVFREPGSPLPLAEAFGRAVLAASDGIHGQEVWLIEGTAPFQLPEIAPGPSSSAPQGFTVSGSRVFFSADDGTTGRELWAFTFNTPPTIGSFTLSPQPAATGTPVALLARVFDTMGETHRALVDWGDGTTAIATETPAPGGVFVRALHVYTTPGLYPVTLTVTDAGGATATRTFRNAIVYDPAGPSVTGAGWIATRQGKANFHLQARYKNGAAPPDGSLRFRLPGLDFESRTLSWLVVRGTTAWIEGEGTLNGAGAYRFRAILLDSRPDRFRLRIQDAATGALVYDTEPSAPDDAQPVTALGGGSIQIHAPQGGKP